MGPFPVAPMTVGIGCVGVVVDFHKAGSRIVFDLKIKIGIFISSLGTQYFTPTLG